MAAAAGRFSSVAMVLPEFLSFDRFGKPIISTGERGGAGKPPSRKRRESRDGEGAALPPTGPPPLRRHLACARPALECRVPPGPFRKAERRTAGSYRARGVGGVTPGLSRCYLGGGACCVRASTSIRLIGAPSTNGRGLSGRDEFLQLSAALQRLQGRFILSLNDVPEVRELFAWAQIETVELSYQAGGAEHTKRVREVVMTNWGGSA